MALEFRKSILIFTTSPTPNVHPLINSKSYDFRCGVMLNVMVTPRISARMVNSNLVDSVSAFAESITVLIVILFDYFETRNSKPASLICRLLKKLEASVVVAFRKRLL